ncbi:MAG: hypothetical protein M3P84_11040 [Chloroflexota bacterium]|nr:hypothetical protein [Chloroflexota bacterium]
MAPPTLTVTGRASKRGLIPRQPPADRVIAEVESWLRLEYPDLVRSTRTRTSGSSDRELLVGLHPAAEELSIVVADDGEVTLSARLAPVGPGYQTFVSRLAQRVGADHQINWAPAGGNGNLGQDLAAAGERASAEQAYLTWLGGGLIEAREARRQGISGIHLGTPAGVCFTFNGAIATNLGPRDDAWLERALVDSWLAYNVTPWWADAIDGQCLLNRALCLMWAHVRWRLPLDDGERLVQEEVIRLLSRAFPLDPSLTYPWREWKELTELRGIGDAMTRQVEARAAKAADDPLVGYRRQPIRITHEGWELDVPGSFAERRTEDEWWGGEAGRSITLAATVTGSAAGPMGAEEFLHQVAPDLGADALSHRAGEVFGRARLTSDATSGVEVGVLEGFSAVVGRGAVIRIAFDDSTDWQWAVDMWRALAPAGRGAFAVA